MRRIAELVIVLASCAALTACGSSSPKGARVGTALPVGRPSPKAVLASIVAAALAQNSVHWTESFPGAGIGYPPVRWSSDVTTDSGMQRVAISGGGTVRARLVNQVVYVRGNPMGLEYELNLWNSQRAKQYAGRWISIPKGDQLYAQTADGLTVASIVHDATPEGTLKVVRNASHWTRLLVVSRISRASLSEGATGASVPVDFTLTPGLLGSPSGNFGRWNEPVHVQPPATSTPIATVRRG